MNYLLKSTIYCGFLLIAVASCKDTPKTTAERPDEPLIEEDNSAAAQIREIMTFWPGTYNNDKQIASAKDNGEAIWLLDDSGEGGYLQVQSHYIKLDKPEIGENVLYVEEYRDHDPAATYRQRIYTLAVDSLGMVKVKMWPFKDKKKYIGAWNNPSILDSLKKDEISAYPDFCDMHVKKTADGYEMYMNDKDCAFGDKYFSYQVRLSANRFSYRDKITVLSTDSLLTTAADFKYHDLDRITE